MKIRDIGFIAEVIRDGEKIVLVGDWAVEFWVEVLGIRSETSRYFRNAIEDQDFQFLGTPRTALALARACGANVRLAAVEDEASQITALVTGNRSGRRWSAEFVGGLRGFSHVQLEQVWQSAMPVVLVPGRQTLLRAIHPVHSLREQLEFAYSYPLGRRREPNGEYHVVCVDLAIEACRRITLRHLKEGDLSGAIRIVEVVHEISLPPAALRARIMDGVRVEGAIVESDAFPKEFCRKRLRHLRRVHKRKVYVYRRRFSHLASDRSDTASPQLLSVGSNQPARGLPVVGLIGWHGMVGSVLVQHMREERDFDFIQPVFFSTTQSGNPAPDIGRAVTAVRDANDLAALMETDVLICCQGGDYTFAIHPKLRAAGWEGQWIDAASTLRMSRDAILVLDPVNRPLIDGAIERGVKDFIGGNCTVSLMLLALAGLFLAGRVEWVSAMTYQAAFGAGARHMRELVMQMCVTDVFAKELLQEPATPILDIDRAVSRASRSQLFPKAEFGHPLAGSLLPWIHKDLGDGQSREEWKGMAEGNRILGLESKPIPIDGLCVRIGSMRCHSQALTVKLTRNVSLAAIERMIGDAHPWVRVIPNQMEVTLRELTPAAVSGTLNVPIGRLRKMAFGPEYLSAFTVGDQLLWGAAEPLRRMLRILLGMQGSSQVNVAAAAASAAL